MDQQPITMTFPSARWGDRWRRIRGEPVEQDLGRYRQPLLAIRILAATLTQLPDGELTARAQALAARARAGALPDSLRDPLFALVVENTRRVLGLSIYDEQLIAGLAMSEGKVVEMQTGEGKTLAAVAPVALHALAGAGAHVLTFNDYLARRDAGWMGPIYRRLGLRVAYVEQGMPADERRQAYAADVTYVTAKEAGFDFLRDQLRLEPDQLVQRPFHFALVDEADSILIDEARIPLVIATHAEEAVGAERMAALVRRLERGLDFDTDPQGRNIALTERGAHLLEQALGCDNLYQSGNQELLADARNALHAQHLLRRDVDYIVRDGRVELVDDFTGRVAEQRQWPDGLQAAVEAKEQVALKNEGRILGSVTVQHFVATYPRLAGMTGTARSAAEELAAFYRLGVVVIPTHRPCLRVDEPDLVFTHAEAKRRALVAEIARVFATARPVLVGTASVQESERLAADLTTAGVPVRVLNARNDAEEAEIVGRAGALGAVTISTNMAGRGTDIRLGGPDQAEHAVVAALGGLYVIGTNRHASLRVDLQLRGRCARQGDPGSSRFFISLEDPLIAAYGVRGLIPPGRIPAPQPEPIPDPLVGREVARAQRIIEGTSFDIRMRLWRYSVRIEQQRQTFQGWRRAILEDSEAPGLLAETCPDRWMEVVQRFGTEPAARLERRLTLLAMDHAWSEHLGLVARIRDGIHVVSFGGKDPLTEFTREIHQAFQEMNQLVDEDVGARFLALHLDGPTIDWTQAGLLGPSSTWTYLVHDQPWGNPMLGLLNRSGLAAAAAAVAGPFLLIWAALLHWRRRRKARTQGSQTTGGALP
jgi:preprotein translocase subunit SecA